MVAAKVTIDTSPIFTAVEGILNRAGHEWLALSQKTSPVRKTGPAQIGSVRLAGGSKLSAEQTSVRRLFVGESSSGKAEALRAYLSAARSGIRRGEVGGKQVQFRVSAATVREERRRLAASVFRFAEGQHKGKAPEGLIARKGRVFGITREINGGTLKAGIELVPATIEGNLVTIILRNLVPYAAPMEYGFRHKGGTGIPARRFMRGPRDNVVLPGLREGKYLRG